MRASFIHQFQGVPSVSLKLILRVIVRYKNTGNKRYGTLDGNYLYFLKSLIATSSYQPVEPVEQKQRMAVFGFFVIN